MTLNIAIRTPVSAGGRLYYHVGGGIVADSTPEAEYAETLHKAAAIENAIVNARTSRRKSPGAR
jgi:anthranilate/para-aminobenzoate synthase component I